MADGSLPNNLNTLPCKVEGIQALANNIKTNHLARQMADKIGHLLPKKMLKLPSVGDLIGLTTLNTTTFAKDALPATAAGHANPHPQLARFDIGWHSFLPKDPAIRFFYDSTTNEAIIVRNQTIFFRQDSKTGQVFGFKEPILRSSETVTVSVDGHPILLDLLFASARYIAKK